MFSPSAAYATEGTITPPSGYVPGANGVGWDAAFYLASKFIDVCKQIEGVQKQNAELCNYLAARYFESPDSVNGINQPVVGLQNYSSYTDYAIRSGDTSGLCYKFNGGGTFTAQSYDARTQLAYWIQYYDGIKSNNDLYTAIIQNRNNQMNNATIINNNIHDVLNRINNNVIPSLSSIDDAIGLVNTSLGNVVTSVSGLGGKIDTTNARLLTLLQRLGGTADSDTIWSLINQIRNRIGDPANFNGMSLLGMINRVLTGIGDISVNGGSITAQMLRLRNSVNTIVDKLDALSSKMDTMSVNLGTVVERLRQIYTTVGQYATYLQSLVGNIGGGGEYGTVVGNIRVLLSRLGQPNDANETIFGYLRNYKSQLEAINARIGGGGDYGSISMKLADILSAINDIKSAVVTIQTRIGNNGGTILGFLSSTYQQMIDMFEATDNIYRFSLPVTNGRLSSILDKLDTLITQGENGSSTNLSGVLTKLDTLITNMGGGGDFGSLVGNIRWWRTAFDNYVSSALANHTTIINLLTAARDYLQIIADNGISVGGGGESNLSWWQSYLNDRIGVGGQYGSVIGNIRTLLSRVGETGTYGTITQQLYQIRQAIHDHDVNVSVTSTFDASAIITAINGVTAAVEDSTDAISGLINDLTLVVENISIAIVNGVADIMDTFTTYLDGELYLLHSDLLRIANAIDALDFDGVDIDVNIDPDNTPHEQLAIDAQALTRKFPFSIPWDVGLILSMFEAAPLTPEFTIPIVWIGYETELHVSLAYFDGVASVARTCSLLVFAIGLLFNTRKLIQLGVD